MGNKISKKRSRRQSGILPLSVSWADNKPPLEIYEMIARFLSERDLSALSLTSKYHRSCTEPTLYEEIRWNYEDFDRSRPQYYWAPIHLLLRTLMSRPKLASCIQGFTINCSTGAPHSMIWRRGEPEYSTEDMSRAKSLIKSLNLLKAEEWIIDLKRGDVDLFLGLLFSMLTNLRRFYLSIKYQQVCKFYFGELLERSVTENSLCSLETIQYGDSGASSYALGDYLCSIQRQSAIDMRQVDLLFSIPSLKHISMSLANNPFQPSFSFTGLSSLDLHHSSVSPSGLGKILLATPCLKSLKYDAWIDVFFIRPVKRLCVGRWITPSLGEN